MCQPKCCRASDEVSRRGSTPLAVADGKLVLGVVELKDIEPASRSVLVARTFRMGITTVMITGDNKLTGGGDCGRGRCRRLHSPKPRRTNSS